MKKIAFCALLCYLHSNAQPKYFEKVWEPWSDVHDVVIVEPYNDGYLAFGRYQPLSQAYIKAYIAVLNDKAEIIDQCDYFNTNTKSNINDFVFNNDEIICTGVINNVALDSSRMFIKAINNDCENGYVSFGTEAIHTGSSVITPTFDSKYIIGGYSIYVTPNYDPWIAYAAKTSATGEVVWQHRYTADFDTTKDSYIQRILPIPQSNDMFYFGCANTIAYTNPQQQDIYMARVDSAGSIIWKIEYSFGSADAIGHAEWTPDQRIVYCGSCHTIDTGGKRGCLVKVDTLGNTVWWHQMTEISYAENFIMVNEGREYVICGEEHIGPPWHLDAAIIKTDSSGNILWKRYYGGPKHDYAYCIAPADDGGYLMMGRKDTTGSTALVYMVKTNCMGLLTEPAAAFTTYQTGDSPLEMAFQNQSQYVYPDSIDGGYYIWDFGDGSPPYVCGRGYAPCAGDVVLHNYATQGQYSVSLTAIVCSDTSTLKQEISVVWTGAEEVAAGTPRISVLPNPAKDLLHIKTLGLAAAAGQEDKQFTLYDLTGKAVRQAVLSAVQPGTTLKVADLPEGMYFWTCTSNHHQAVRSGKITILR